MKELTLLFLRRHDQILLAMKKRGFGAGRWNGVGGKLEVGESIEAALIRECQEEIGVTPTTFVQVAEIEFEEYHHDEKRTMRVHVFLGSAWEGEPSESEEMAPEWFDTTNLPLTDMWPDDEFWLPRVLQGQKLRCRFHLDRQDRIIRQEVQEVPSL